MTDEGMLHTRVAAIEARNARVELDKAWERSLTRRLSIAVITYIAACVFLMVIDADHPYLGALVPMGGYLLSTLALPWMRTMWERKHA